MNTAVEKSLAEAQARSQQQLLEKLSEEKGQNSAGAAFGVGRVVQALSRRKSRPWCSATS